MFVVTWQPVMMCVQSKSEECKDDGILCVKCKSV